MKNNTIFKKAFKKKLKEKISQSKLFPEETISVRLIHADNTGLNDLKAYLEDLTKLGAENFSDEAKYVVGYRQQGNNTIIDVRAPTPVRAEDIVYELVMDAAMSYAINGSIEIKDMQAM